MNGDYYYCKECGLAYPDEDCDASYESTEKGAIQIDLHCPNCSTPVTLIDADQIDPSIFDHQGTRP
jgi:hypothetical protein